MNALSVRISVILFFLVSAFALFFFPEASEPQNASTARQESCGEGLLCVHYFDVGQGDATFIESPTGVEVLIDGGPDGSALRELTEAQGFFDRDIDIIIATHPDQDHIGGLIDILERYHVDAIVLTENKNDTVVSDTFDDYSSNEGAEIIYARSGQVIDIGLGKAGSTTLTILFPDRDASDMESNAASIIARLSYGETDFIFMGDSPRTVEEFLVETYGSGLESEVLKVGHHGSRTSTDEDFLEAVNPVYAIISAGKDNRYGHPHVEVTDMLFNHQVETLNTAEVGSIMVTSDGMNVIVSE